MSTGPRETEVKFCVRRLAAVEERLRAAQARLIQPRTLEVNLRFDTAGGDLQRQGRVLRLRQDERARITYKDDGRFEDGAVSRREIEFTVGDMVAARQFLEALGYQLVFLYEKYRATFAVDQTQIMLDQLPYGDFVEIEGESEVLRPAAERLGLNWAAAIPASYHGLFERLSEAGQVTFRDLSFENFTGLRVVPAQMRAEYADR